MSTELKIVTAEEYCKLSTKLVKLTSGSVFEIKIMGADSTVKYLSIVPNDGVKQEQLKDFLIANSAHIVKWVVMPNIVAPKIPEDYLKLTDAMELLIAMLEFSGLTPEDTEQIEKFRQE